MASGPDAFIQDHRERILFLREGRGFKIEKVPQTLGHGRSHSRNFEHLQEQGRRISYAVWILCRERRTQLQEGMVESNTDLEEVGQQIHAFT